MARKYRKRSNRRKRRTTRSRIPRGLFTRANVLQTKRFVIRYTATGADATPSGGVAVTFSPSDVPAFSEFTALFEEFQFAGIAYRFVLNRDPAFATTTANRGYPVRVIMAHDHTDSTTPSFADLQQYPKCREVWLSQNKTLTKWYWLKPNTINVGYTTGVASNYGTDYKRWVDSANTSTPYYGLKFAYDLLVAGEQLLLECKYYMKFRGTK